MLVSCDSRALFVTLVLYSSWYHSGLGHPSSLSHRWQGYITRDERSSTFLVKVHITATETSEYHYKERGLTKKL